MADDPDDFDIDKMEAVLFGGIHELQRRAETSYVVFTVTGLEDLLEQALLAIMRELSSTAYSALFRGYGPLASFSAKIDLAFALKIIDGDTKIDFHTIRDIRNKFAHPTTIAHFANTELDSVFQKLKGWNKDANTKTLFDQCILRLVNLMKSRVDQSIFDSVWGVAPESSHDKS